jgi:hypothetical protein
LAIVRFEGSCHTLFSGGKRCATMDAVRGAILVCRAIAVPDLPLKLWQRKEPLVPCSHPCAIPVQYKSREKAVEGVYRGCIPAAQRVGILAKRYGSCGTAPKGSANADFRCHTCGTSYGTAPKGVAPAWTEAPNGRVESSPLAPRLRSCYCPCRGHRPPDKPPAVGNLGERSRDGQPPVAAGAVTSPPWRRAWLSC